MKIANPIIPGFHPDPSICRVGDDYYVVTSSFEYFPGVPIFHSRDLAHWRQIGHVLTRASQLPLPNVRASGGIFAPTIRHHDGVFYMITTNMTSGGNFFVRASDPAGPWSEPTWLDQGGIDPSLHFGDDGRVYLTSTYTSGPVPDEIDPASFSWGVQQSEIDIATGRILTPPRPIWGGTGGKYPESPHLYKIGGRYYLMIAEGGTEYGHMVTIARAASPWGPWEPCPHNPILSHRSRQNPIQGLGHADLVQAPDGAWWMVCLGFRPHGYPPRYHLGRETFLAPVRWDADGWPHVGAEGTLASTLDVPGASAAPWEPPPARDDFDAPALGLEWNFLGNPDPASWSLADRPGALRLLGGAAALDDGAPAVFVGRRQQHFDCQAAAALEFDPAGEGEAAGLTVWMNERHHYDLLVTRRGGARTVVARQRIGGLASEVASAPLAPGRVTLTIRADRDRYSFACAADGAPEQRLATGETRYLTTEVAGGFTGVYLAMHATGGGRPSASPAYFDWFEYRSL
jgi:alpha-N-arabinofuranosidase